MKQLDKTYDHAKVENRIYKMWMEGNYFAATIDESKKPYTIIMPPPNITGQLHIGHAMDNTLPDILIRTRRMQGYSTLWLPGTDHASIATEARIVESMKQEGITKADIGREAFLERAWRWNDRFGSRIIEQLKRLGSSCDWDRRRFTMDEGASKAVRDVFIDYYNKGLIYRGERIINWCPACKTSISDAEVEFEEHEGHLYYIKYPLTDGDGYITVATTRPETMLGDTAVAVNPDDERYSFLVGKTATLPLINREIPIIADSYVESDFGTGAVKITPAHDPNDFEVSLRHNIPSINVMNEDATINENGEQYIGLDRYEAREKILEDLTKEGLLEKIETRVHNVGSCYRCHTVIEPRLSMQWFVKMKPLAEPAIAAVEEGRTKFVPERFDRTYFNWMNNIRDWCISRQLWWGHRIPAYYCENCGEIIVSSTEPEKCNRCGGKVHQDEDTLDTWFSSALWPFSTLGWPEATPELKYFYPTDTLVTGYDIIFFWVARMIFSALENTKDVPFKTVVIHGLVRDDQGRKMSKSLNNGVDPIDMIETYGADALRYTLVGGVGPGNDVRFSDEKIKSARNFTNKIWNAARFILMNDVSEVIPNSLPNNLKIEDKWLLTGLNQLVKEVTENIDNFETGIAAVKIYDFLWDVFCDWYIEIAKLRLNGENEKEKEDCKKVLVYSFTTLLKILHPFMPFITEEIYQALPHIEESIMISSFPVFSSDLVFTEDMERFEHIMALIKAVRASRAEMNVPMGKKVNIFIETKDEGVFYEGIEFIKRLAFASNVHIGSEFDIKDAVQIVTSNARVYIPMDELADRDKELIRLSKERDLATNDIAQLESRLLNEKFVAKAPPAIVDQERTRLSKAKEKLALIEQSIAKLG